MALKTSPDKHEKSSEKPKKEQSRNKQIKKIIEIKHSKIKNDVLEGYAGKNIIPVRCDKKLSIVKTLTSSHRKPNFTNEYYSGNPYILSFDYKVAMATYCPQYMVQPTFNFPMIINEWNPIIPSLHPAIYSPPVQQLPVSVLNLAQLCPYAGTVFTEPLISSMIPQTMMAEPLAENYYEPLVNCVSEQMTSRFINVVDDQVHYKVADEENIASEDMLAITEMKNSVCAEDPLEYYLNLPKELFPTARMFAIDPNPMIDEFCKQANISDHATWILDLEFGIPRVAITRAIPIYDVQFNSIHCKNTPTAIHPGFESCDEDFKRVLLFYYDCIVSVWYRSYVIMNNDRSVENFQAWLLMAMQFFGMCWP